MDKSFYYAVPWNNANLLKEDLTTIGIPFMIAQLSGRQQLQASEVAFVFPDLHVRRFNHVQTLFGNAAPYRF